LKRIYLAFLVALGLLTVIIAIGYRNATSDPIVRVASFEAPELSAGRPLRILFLADTHVQRPDMAPERLTRILLQLNAQHPDLILLGGDYTGEMIVKTRRYSLEESVRPFRVLKAPLGVVAVLGNHDRAAAPTIRAAFASVGVTVLEDEAQQFGPIAVGGIFDRPKKTVRRMMRLGGAKIVLAHAPERILWIPPMGLLVVAGDTHCGQIVLPVVGALAIKSSLPRDLICGFHRYGGNLLIVTAGLGTSHVPLRFGASPDAWLILLQPQQAGAASTDGAARIQPQAGEFAASGNHGRAGGRSD
jgi:predicted MPP superfamily phosphohydrolase